jgi:hypothetical protein
MDNVFVISGIISFIFFIIKFIEMRFINKENKGMKNILRDTILVFVSVIMGGFLNNQIGAAGKAINGQGDVTVAFTDKPDF